MAAALWFKTFVLVFLLLFMPFSYAVMVDDGFQDGKQAKSSLAQSLSSALGGRMTQLQMSSSRKLLTMMMSTNAMLDYDDAGANPKHDPRKKPGKP